MKTDVIISENDVTMIKNKDNSKNYYYNTDGHLVRVESGDLVIR